jgi:pimeloyl-ACP methyl ester carboxylesterase
MSPGFVDLHGSRVAYRDTGGDAGTETLLLLHGMSGSSRDWRDVMPLLAQRHRVIAPDLPGHGQSDRQLSDFSLSTLAVWLRDLLDALHVIKVTVVGHSLSGGVAMQFAHQHRGRCERVVLIGSGGVGQDLGWMLKVLSTPGAEYVLPAVTPKPVVTAGNAVRGLLSAAGVRSPRAAQLWSTYCAMSDPDTRHALLRTLRSVADVRDQPVAALTRRHESALMPVLLVWGEDDLVIPVAHGRAAHAALPGSRLVVLPGVGHHPHVEAPQEVADVLADFVATTERRSIRMTRC